MNKALENKILEMKDDIISAILQSVAINSVKGEPAEDAPYGEGPKEALIDAIKQSEKLGLNAVNVDNKIGYTEIGSGDEMVAILGHLDIVPVGDNWTKNPFGEISDGKLYGRGTADDKGPTISALYILKAIKDLDISLDRRIRVIYGTDEESGFDCVRHYIASGQELPVAGFTPDADYPAIFAEKGGLGFLFSKNISPTEDFELLTLKGGVAKNVVTPSIEMTYKSKKYILKDSQKISDDVYKVQISGKSAHASTPEKGLNAFMLLCKELDELGGSGDIFDLARFIHEKYNFEPNGKSMGVFYEDEMSGEITLSIGMVEFVDSKLQFTLDIRYPISMQAEPCIEKLSELAVKNGLEVEVTSKTKPHYVPKDSPLIKTLMEVYREKTGDLSEPIAIGGGTYAKAFKNMVAFGVEFPGEPLLIHQADECIKIDDLIKSTQISAEAIVRLANATY